MLWAGVVLAALGALLGAAPERAIADEETDGYFSDDDGSVHEPALEALASRGVLAGIECGEGLICPSEPLTRWEMAVWLVRVLDGAHPASVDTERFSDVDYDLWWAPFVEQLFDMGITVGCRRNPLQYCPDSAVTRAQMATFLKRAFDLEPAPSAGFTDVSGGSHTESIDALAAAGITVGCSRDPLRYCPASNVSRAQMATFLARASGLVELPASVRFTAIEAGDQHACGLRADRAIVCWGESGGGQADAPDGEFLAVSAGMWHSCGLRADGSVTCWGASNFEATEAPDGEFVQVSTGLWHSCGLRADGSVTCWGSNDDGQLTPPEEPLQSVTAGERHTCGIRADDTVLCWGHNESGQSDAPQGEFSSVSAGRRHTCGVRLDGTVTCWGNEWFAQAEELPAGTFIQVSAGAYHSCGLRTDKTIVCWGFDALDRLSSPDGQFSAVSAGGAHSCGVRTDGFGVCWGYEYADPRDAPDGTFNAVGIGSDHGCGLRTDGAAVCWGHQRDGRSFPPHGSLIDISIGLNHSCAVRTAGAVTCWGGGTEGQSSAPGGQFKAVSAGGHHSCGLLTDGSIVCWGDNNWDELSPPDGRFHTVAAGLNHSCGLRPDGAVACWGSNENGRSSPPDGRFSAVSAGGGHSCGLRTDGSIVCWGHLRRSEAPDGPFESISAGFQHSCGVRTDGTISCWGDDTWGQSSPPDGHFSVVAAGRRHSCGLRTDGTIVCWGAAIVEPPVSVKDAARPGRPDPSRCRPYGGSGYSAGFPLPRLAAPSVGTLRVAVVFVDFPDAPAAHSTQREAELGLPYVEEYLEASSYGRLDVQVTPLHRWLRAEREHAHHLSPDRKLARGISEEAVRLSDPLLDFNEYDVLMVVMPSSHFQGGTAGTTRTPEGVLGAARINFLSLRVNMGSGVVEGP